MKSAHSAERERIARAPSASITLAARLARVRAIFRSLERRFAAPTAAREGAAAWLRVPTPIAAAVLAGLYVGSAKLGLSLSVAYGNVTPVWPPTGISLAALLLLGFRLWPGVALGAFIANVTTPIPIGSAAGIAVGNTLEAVFGAYLLRRVARFDPSLERARDVIALATLGALVSTAVSATFGATSLLLGNEIGTSTYGYAWSLWWFGDAMGDLLVAPVILVWAQPARGSPASRRVFESLVLAAALVSVGWFVFFGGRWSYPFLVFPLLIWAALRFRQRGASAAAFGVSGVAIWATLDGSVPIVGASLTQSVAVLQTLMSIIAVTSLILAATITEREKADEAVRKREAQLASAQQIAHFGSWEWEVAENRMTWSDELHRIYGLSSGAFEATYEAFLERVHPGDREMVQAVVAAGLSEGVPFGFDHRILRPDGTERILHARAEVLRDATGAPIRVVGTAQDITEPKRVEQELRRLDVAKSEFIANAAHELRTPLTILDGFTSILASGHHSLPHEEVDRYFEILTRQADRVNILVHNLLDLSQIELGGLRVDLQAVPVRAAVERAVEVAPPPEGTDVAVAVADGLSVLADPVRLEQVLTNLLANAYRYGGRAVRIEAGAAGERVVLAVGDDGPGVPADLVPHLFEPFARGTHTGRARGSGLGLAIVRRLVRAFDGEVWYVRREPQGADFVVRLKRAP